MIYNKKHLFPTKAHTWIFIAALFQIKSGNDPDVWCTDKPNVVHPFSGILLRNKNELHVRNGPNVLPTAQGSAQDRASLVPVPAASSASPPTPHHTHRPSGEALANWGHWQFLLRQTGWWTVVGPGFSTCWKAVRKPAHRGAKARPPTLPLFVRVRRSRATTSPYPPTQIDSWYDNKNMSPKRK